jgi:hypothetical protein
MKMILVARGHSSASGTTPSTSAKQTVFVVTGMFRELENEHAHYVAFSCHRQSGRLQADSHR